MNRRSCGCLRVCDDCRDAAFAAEVDAEIETVSGAHILNELADHHALWMRLACLINRQLDRQLNWREVEETSEVYRQVRCAIAVRVVRQRRGER